MMKYLFIEFNRYDLDCSEVSVIEGSDDIWEVRDEVMREVFNMDEEDVELSKKGWYEKRGKLYDDGDESGYVLMKMDDVEEVV